MLKFINIILYLKKINLEKEKRGRKRKTYMKSNVHVRKQMRESCGQRGKQVSVPIFSGHPNTDNARLNPLSLSRVHGSSYSLSLSDTTTR